MKDFWEYVVKNKYVIICVIIVVILYALGIVDFLTKAVVLLALIGLAVFVGKKIQDNEGKIKNVFDFVKNKEYKDNVYYYQKKDDEK
ncbi:MAG: hypothetical protein PHP54_01535 [Clostridia bacterium]|nr:hypothetical protein [Clostridia bacterium]